MHGTIKGRIGTYVHLADACSAAHVGRTNSIYWYKTLEDKYKFQEQCDKHKNRNCMLLDEDVAFLLFLYWIQDKDSDKLEPSDAEEKTVEELEVVEEFVESEEKLWTRGFDIARFKASNITKVEEPLEPSEDEMEMTSCTATFPVYRVNNKQYVLLSDVQHLFDLREDYCFAILADWGKNDKDFVASEPCPLAILDTESEEFIGKEIVGCQIKDMIVSYEEQGLPTEEEFEQIQKRLKIEHMGREEPRDSTETKPLNSINLWREALLEDDENPKVHCNEKKMLCVTYFYIDISLY